MCHRLWDTRSKIKFFTSCFITVFLWLSSWLLGMGVKRDVDLICLVVGLMMKSIRFSKVYQMLKKYFSLVNSYTLYCEWSHDVDQLCENKACTCVSLITEQTSIDHFNSLFILKPVHFLTDRCLQNRPVAKHSKIFIFAYILIATWWIPLHAKWTLHNMSDCNKRVAYLTHI